MRVLSRVKPESWQRIYLQTSNEREMKELLNYPYHEKRIDSNGEHRRQLMKNERTVKVGLNIEIIENPGPQPQAEVQANCK